MEKCLCGMNALLPLHSDSIVILKENAVFAEAKIYCRFIGKRAGEGALIG